MTKVSSNAGKHSYLRPENSSFFDNLITKKHRQKRGLPLLPYNDVKFVIMIKTDYVDKNNRELYYNDVVSFNHEDYVVDYDSRNYCWIIRSENNSKKIEILSKIASLTILKTKYN